MCELSEENFIQCNVNENSYDENASFMSNDVMNLDFDSYVVEMDSIEIKLNAQISKQMSKIWGVATLHGKHFECNVQCTDPISNVSILFDVVNAIGNGDCMLSASAHQLYGKDIDSDEHKRLTNELRASVVKYMQEHYGDFFFDIRGHVYELQEIAAKHPDRDEYGIAAIANIDDACKYFLDKCLTRRGFWAGAETLKAIHLLHKVDIIVLNENGPIAYYNQSNEQIHRTIVLAFRVSADPDIRNHYDSVCNVQSDGIYKIANILSKRLSQISNSTINLDTSQ